MGEKTSLPVFSLKEACRELHKDSEVIYLGWLMASVIKGYKKANKNFRVKAVCAVGMAPCGSQIKEVTAANKLGKLPVFVLQGGFDISKLHGINKLMMTVMKKTAGKALSEKKDRTAEEDEMLDMLLNGKNCVRVENLAPVLNLLSEN